MADFYFDKRHEQPWWAFWDRIIIRRTERIHREAAHNLFERAAVSGS